MAAGRWREDVLTQSDRKRTRFLGLYRVYSDDIMAGRPVPLPDAAFARDYLRETVGSMEDFQNAVRRIEGLEWLGEWDQEDIPTYSVEFYLLMTNQEAMQQLLSPWQRYQDEDNPKCQWGRPNGRRSNAPTGRGSRSRSCLGGQHRPESFAVQESTYFQTQHQATTILSADLGRLDPMHHRVQIVEGQPEASERSLGRITLRGAKRLGPPGRELKQCYSLVARADLN
jgi:hypothetical protein